MPHVSTDLYIVKEKNTVVDILIVLMAAVAVVSLGLNVWLLMLMFRLFKSISLDFANTKSHIEKKFKANEQNRTQQQAALLSRIDELKADLWQELNRHTNHSDVERVKALNEMRQDLSAAIDRLENFLREPLI